MAVPPKADYDTSTLAGRKEGAVDTRMQVPPATAKSATAWTSDDRGSAFAMREGRSPDQGMPFNKTTTDATAEGYGQASATPYGAVVTSTPTPGKPSVAATKYGASAVGDHPAAFDGKTVTPGGETTFAYAQVNVPGGIQWAKYTTTNGKTHGFEPYRKQNG